MTVKPRKTMAKEEEYDKLPDKDAAKEFYAKYEPKEILGRYVYICWIVVQTDNCVSIWVPVGEYLRQ